MAKKQPPNVTMRVRIGETEFEVTGPTDYVEKKIEEFLVKYQETSKLEPQKVSPPPAKWRSPEGGKSVSPAQFFKDLKLNSQPY